MKILVTGGAGFIGSHIAEAYRDAGHEVVVLDTLVSGSRENIPAGVRFVEADIRDHHIKDFFISENFDAVNHHAALVSVPESYREPVEYASVNVAGTVSLFHAAAECGVRRFIFASTGVLYAESDELPYAETHPLAPLDPYGASKLAAEQFIATMSARYPAMEIVTLRYGNVYGPRQRVYGEGNLVAVCAAKLCRGEQPTIFGDGTHTRDYVFVGDVAELNTLLLNSPVVGTFNVGTGIERSVLEIYREVAHAVGVEPAPVFGPPRSEQAHIALSPVALHQATGWRPLTTLAEGIRQTVAWFCARTTPTNAHASSPKHSFRNTPADSSAAGVGD
ncbi:MAG: NAD-dependent epimerase/dehydratase family protein [Chlorobi bacterium]|nr:NAD-dependent epimerase/dehydratase family protein [Chlorobiota bacterium]